jgi:hypothetical protein
MRKPWERRFAQTLACPSGACAVALPSCPERAQSNASAQPSNSALISRLKRCSLTLCGQVYRRAQAQARNPAGPASQTLNSMRVRNAVISRGPTCRCGRRCPDCATRPAWVSSVDAYQPFKMLLKARGAVRAIVDLDDQLDVYPVALIFTTP